MQFCKPHWERLKTALDARGLTKFIAPDGEEAMRRVASQVEEVKDVAVEAAEKAHFEPLMGAMFAIFNNTLGVVGIELLAPNEDGSSRCPLCHLRDGCSCGEGENCGFMTWIDRAADDELKKAKELGLIGES